MNGILDMTACKASITETRFDCLIVPFEKGKDRHEFDVMESKCPTQFIERIAYRSALAYRRRGVLLAARLGIGFDIRNLPEGATITINT